MWWRFFSEICIAVGCVLSFVAGGLLYAWWFV